jgi:hypothetical protein
LGSAASSDSANAITIQAESEDFMLNTQLMRNGYGSGTIVTVDGGSVLV